MLRVVPSRRSGRAMSASRAPVTSRHVAEIAGHRVAHRGAVDQRRRLASIPTTDRQQQRPHGLASGRRDDKGPELVRSAIDRSTRGRRRPRAASSDRSALEPLGRASDARRQDLFSHLGPRGDRVRSHPEPKSCERQALALRDDGLKAALLARTVERRDAVHSCKPKACRTRPELGPRRLLAQLTAAGHGHHNQEHQHRESQKPPDDLPHRITGRNAACPTRSVCPVLTGSASAEPSMSATRGGSECDRVRHRLGRSTQPARRSLDSSLGRTSQSLSACDGHPRLRPPGRVAVIRRLPSRPRLRRTHQWTTYDWAAPGSRSAGSRWAA